MDGTTISNTTRITPLVIEQSGATPSSARHPHHVRRHQCRQSTTHAEAITSQALDAALRIYGAQDANSAMRAPRLLRDALSLARAAAGSPAAWRTVIDQTIRPHPVFNRVLEDPFVHRCYAKPRGYAGDAELLDFIYQHPAARPALDATTPCGRASANFTTNAPGPRAVRNRAWLLAEEIDRTEARAGGSTEILSLACGHLREASLSRALAGGRCRRFLALDQDAASLAVVREHAGTLGVEAREGSVKTVIARSESLGGRFDFVYAAGLYDYLSDKVAARLLQALFDLTKPGGKVWIANFAPGIDDIAFMEAFMDWWLIYRDEAQMQALADQALPPAELDSTRVFTEHENNIVFLEAVRQ